MRVVGAIIKKLIYKESLCNHNTRKTRKTNIKMGLDMYAYTVSVGVTEYIVGNVPENWEEIANWRKFNALHGWMEEMARSAGYRRPNFDPTSTINGNQLNNVAVKLSPDIIDRLEHDIDHGLLKPHHGLYFGELKIYPEDVEDTREFIANARTAFSAKKDVYYYADW